MIEKIIVIIDCYFDDNEDNIFFICLHTILCIVYENILIYNIFKYNT